MKVFVISEGRFRNSKRFILPVDDFLNILWKSVCVFARDYKTSSKHLNLF